MAKFHPLLLGFLGSAQALNTPMIYPASRMRLRSLAGATVGSANLEWSELGFEFRPTKSFLQFTWTESSGWDKGFLKEGEPTVNVHIAATGLHYGQSCFEGLKAFARRDGKVALFRPIENARRMQRSGERVMMPALDDDAFVAACARVVNDNLAFVPPYGSGGALYLRPLLFGSGARIGLSPAAEYTLLIMCMPVGDYYKGGLSKPVRAMVVEDFDRAAPLGVGSAKVAGNYAADLLPNQKNKKNGFPISLYLDAKSHTMVEEFSTSNFFGIKRGAQGEVCYITPASKAILPSITNKSLMELAASMGYRVEQRVVPATELETFSEVAACGTAVVITPVGSITLDGKEHIIGTGCDGNVGPICAELYSKIRAIQQGDAPDTFGWTVAV
jgi:branched-chain amino acid aminotransferase